MRSSTIPALLLSLLALTACDAGRNRTNVELIQDMMNQKSYRSQDYDEKRGEATYRVPPEGTVPRGFTPYKYAGNPLAAEANLVNPLAGNAAKLMMDRGQEQYRIYCSVCHGTTGQGDGSVAQYMSLRPPPLVSDKVKNFKDGRIFHIITDGQGVMSSYLSQVKNERDRWAIVNYVRRLQGK